MTSAAIRSQGTVVKHGTTAIEEVRDVKLNGVQTSTIDVTHLTSSSKEFLAGLKDNGTVDLTCNFTNGTVQQAVRTDANAGTTAAYSIVIPGPGSSTTTMTFNAFVTKFDGPTAGVDRAMDLMISLKRRCSPRSGRAPSRSKSQVSGRSASASSRSARWASCASTLPRTSRPRSACASSSRRLSTTRDQRCSRRKTSRRCRRPAMRRSIVS